MDLIIFFLFFWILSKILAKFGFKTKPVRLISVTLVIIGSIVLIVAYMLYTLPSQTYVKGSSIPIIPALIGLATLSCAVFLIIKKEETITEGAIRNLPFYSWVLYTFAIAIITISKYGFLFSIYSPAIFKSNIQIPHVGVGIFITGCFLAALTLYAFSHFSYIRSPNVTFGISYILIVYCFYLITLYTLLLTYGLIGKYSVSYPFLSSIMVLGYLPLVLVLLAKIGRK